MRSSPTSIKPAIWWIFACTYVLLSLFVMGRYLLTSNMGDTWRAASLEQMVFGRAERPYVYRRLVPVMTLAVMKVTPVEVHRQVGDSMSSFFNQLEIIQAIAGQKRMFRLALEKTDSYYIRSVAAIIVYGFLWLYIISMHKLAVHFFPHSIGMQFFTPVIGLLLVPSLMVPTAYVYDIAALGLAAACYYCLAVARWRWFFFWFALACLNKETAIFVTGFFALWFWIRMDRKEFLTLLGWQLLMFAVIRGAIYWQFKDNEGIFLATSYIVQQAAIIIEGYDYKTLAVILTAAFLLTYRWQEKPLFARYGILLMVGMYVAYFLFGRPNEFRVFLDVLPLLVILVTHTLIECTGIARVAWLANTKDKVHDEP